MTERTIILSRHADGSPALWLREISQEIIRADGSRYIDYEGSSLSDDRMSIAFDPSIEDLELAVSDWQRATR